MSGDFVSDGRRDSPSDLLVHHMNRLIFVSLQHRKEGFLWDFDVPHATHSFFPLFLFLQQLSFTRDITTIAFCRNILSEWGITLLGDNLVADGGLNDHLEHLSRYGPLELESQRTTRACRIWSS